jgi:hypothetical protein
MKKKLLRGLLAVVVVGAAWFTYVAFAHRNLVTLDVRNMDVREVIRKIEGQTHQSISVHKEVEGKITLNVRRVPLEEVLNIIDDQAESRWSVIYPLYTTSGKLETLKKALRGELEPPVFGWTNLHARGFFRGGFGGGGGFAGGGFGGGFGGGGPGRGGFGGGPPGDVPRNENRLVSLEFDGKDLSFATLALARYAQARVVPEDGTSASVSLKLNKASVSDAVAQLAKKVHRSWTKLYVLQGGFGDRRRGPQGDLAMRDQNGDGRRGDDGGRRGRDWRDMTDEQREELRKERDTINEELKQALLPEDRQKLEQQQQQAEQFRQELQNMTPEQRRDRFQQMAGNREQRTMSMVKNTTPEQRAERYTQREQRRQLWQQRQGQSR